MLSQLGHSNPKRWAKLCRLETTKKQNSSTLSAMRSTIKVRNERLAGCQWAADVQQDSCCSLNQQWFATIWICQFRAPSPFDAVSMSKTARAALNRILDLYSNLVSSSRHCSYSHRRRSSSVYYCVKYTLFLYRFDTGVCAVNKNTFPKLVCRSCLWWIRFSEAQHQGIRTIQESQ